MQYWKFIYDAYKEWILLTIRKKWKNLKNQQENINLYTARKKYFGISGWKEAKTQNVFSDFFCVKTPKKAKAETLWHTMGWYVCPHKSKGIFIYAISDLPYKTGESQSSVSEKTYMSESLKTKQYHISVIPYQNEINS